MMKMHVHWRLEIGDAREPSSFRGARMGRFLRNLRLIELEVGGFSSCRQRDLAVLQTPSFIEKAPVAVQEVDLELAPQNKREAHQSGHIPELEFTAATA